jgi:hypothetical protein
MVLMLLLHALLMPTLWGFHKTWTSPVFALQWPIPPWSSFKKGEVDDKIASPAVSNDPLTPPPGVFKNDGKEVRATPASRGWFYEAFTHESLLSKKYKSCWLPGERQYND